ncbi:zinc finger CCHC domain-containing protein 8-like, partial [Saccostrea cucullata]|uniref:zinc finger CCHC domain-containing protein 8-like n=1 Tax=Saccostrea cuccullata TaxID=36930 RepID=UPI002ED5EDAF
MEEDMFTSVSELFNEFEKDRNSSTFISFDYKNDGHEDKSKILFTLERTDGESTDEESENESNFTTCTALKELGTTDNDSSENDDTLIIPERLFNESEAHINKTNDTSYKLTHERNKIKRFANIIDSTRYVHDEESPGCQIIFQNNRFSRKYRPEIEKFIAQLMERDACDSEVLPDVKLKASTPSCVDINEKLDATMRTSEMWEAHAIIGADQFYRECIVDKMGFQLTGYDTALAYGWEIPVYPYDFYTELVQMCMNNADGKAAKLK